MDPPRNRVKADRVHGRDHIIIKALKCTPKLCPFRFFFIIVISFPPTQEFVESYHNMVCVFYSTVCRALIPDGHFSNVEVLYP